MMRYYGRRKITPEQTAANAAKREARKQAAMMCQVCGRSILANTGVIAHHGYQRPGDGWQTASCGGAKALPYEVSRDALGREIDMAERHLEVKIDTRRRGEAEETELAWIYQVKGPLSALGQAPERLVMIRRETFDAAHEAYMTDRRYRMAGGDPTFDSLKEAWLRARSAEISKILEYIAAQRKRFDLWSQTHRRVADRWELVE